MSEHESRSLAILTICAMSVLSALYILSSLQETDRCTDRGQAQCGIHNHNNAVVSNHVHSASAVKLTVNYMHIMAETNADYQFMKNDIWVMDSRMTAFAADLKTSNWASVDEAPDLQVLRLNHLFIDDEADEHKLRKVSGKEKHSS